MPCLQIILIASEERVWRKQTRPVYVCAHKQLAAQCCCMGELICHDGTSAAGGGSNQAHVKVFLVLEITDRRHGEWGWGEWEGLAANAEHTHTQHGLTDLDSHAQTAQ